MALTAGWAPIDRLWFSASPDNPFLNTRSKQLRDFMVWLFESANIADYKGLPRGMLRFDQTSAAKVFNVSRRTIQKWLKTLQTKGLIVLAAKVACSKAVKTLVHIVSYPSRRPKGSMMNSASYIDPEREKNSSNPLPPEGGKAKGEHSGESAYRFRRYKASVIAGRIVHRLKPEDEASFELRDRMGPVTTGVIDKAFGSWTKYFRHLNEKRRQMFMPIKDPIAFDIERTRRVLLRAFSTDELMRLAAAMEEI